jgi:two-component system response regulator AtoC
MHKILVVEDEKNIRESIEVSLSDTYDIRTASGAEAALELIKAEVFELLITDIRLPGMDGISLMRRFKEICPQCPVIVITAFSSIQNAVEAMKAGANEYVPKPFSLEEIEIKVKNLLNIKKISDEKDFYVSEKDSAFGDIIGASRSITDLKKDLAKAAPSDITVLITGDTGTGKELVAYTIHKLSGRKGPFVPVHCAAYAKGVIESELFGHEKGSFTGADRQRKGKIELAEGGTLFLDELGDIPLDIQVKLLRLIENRTYERVGGNKSMETGARILCATNRNLEAMIKAGAFREDLYYRVNVFPIHIPPLKERGEDIAALAEYFAKKRGNFTINATNKILLEEYAWPGNVRELQNIVERAVILSEDNNLRIDLALGKIPVNEAAQDRGFDPDGKNLDEMLADIEKKFIITALKNNGYNQSKSAKSLRINRTTLQYKMQKYGIKEKE